jgi:nickel transport system substrate-binding protein
MHTRPSPVVHLAVVLAAVGMALAGCSANSTPENKDTPVGRPDGTLRIAIAQAETSISVRDYKTHSFNVLDEVYEPLVRYAADGSIKPALAESFTITADGLGMTFQLRPNVTFSDGTPFTAAVAKAELERWVFDKANSFLGITGHTKSIEVTGERTLSWVLSQPYYSALNELALVRPVRFMSPTAYAADGSVKAPIGTGPFKVQSMDNQKVVLVRNDTYWGGKPLLNQVIFTVIPDASARVAALKAGEVDVIGGEYLAPLALEDAQAIKQSSNVRLLTDKSTTNLLLTYNVDTGNPALSDVRVRKAIGMAIDRDSIASGLFAGQAQPAPSIFPSNVPYGPKSGTATLDVAGARALLDGAGWSGTDVRTKNGTQLALKLLLNPSSLPQAKSLSEVVQAQLKQIGIAVQITPLDSTAYSAAVADRAFDLRFYLTYGAPYDPYSMLTANFRTIQANHLFASSELDTQIPVALAATEEASRQKEFDTIWKLLDDQAAAIPLVQLPRLWAISDKVKGFQLGATEYDLPLTGVSIGG